MKKITRFLALITLSILTTVAVAAEPMKIGVVNAQRLLGESPQAKAAQRVLEDEFSPVQAEMVVLQNAFKAKQEKLQRDIDVMSADERRNAERDLQNDQRNLQRRANELNEDFELRRDEMLGRMQQDLFSEIQRYANENGYDLVLGDGVLYMGGSLDITDEVLKGLEARFKAAK
jgi:outer membrane protein|tara:strand:+ start:1119 stop:1640 length:522 start_codon:yes stop_codon:yes gene_type:complete